MWKAKCLGVGILTVRCFIPGYSVTDRPCFPGYQSGSQTVSIWHSPFCPFLAHLPDPDSLYWARGDVLGVSTDTPVGWGIDTSSLTAAQVPTWDSVLLPTVGISMTSQL